MLNARAPSHSHSSTGAGAWSLRFGQRQGLLMRLLAASLFYYNEVATKVVFAEVHRMQIAEDWINPDLHFRHLYGVSKDYDAEIEKLDCQSLKSMILTNHELLEIHSNAVNADGSFNVVLLDNDQVSGWVDVEPLLEGCSALQKLYQLATVGTKVCRRSRRTRRSTNPDHSVAAARRTEMWSSQPLQILQRELSCATFQRTSSSSKSTSQTGTPFDDVVSLVESQLRKDPAAFALEAEPGDILPEVEARSVYRGKSSLDVKRESLTHALELLQAFRTDPGAAKWTLGPRFHRRFGRVLRKVGQEVATDDVEEDHEKSPEGLDPSLSWYLLRNFAIQALALYLDRVTQHVTLKSLPFFNLGADLNLGFLFHKVNMKYEHGVFGFRFDVIFWLAEQQLLRKLEAAAAQNKDTTADGASAQFDAEKARRQLYSSATDESHFLGGASTSDQLRRPKLRIAEVGVEKGETVRYVLQKLGKWIEYYAVIDPYYMEGKPTLDDVLEYYSQNVTEVCESHNLLHNNSACVTHRVNSLDFRIDEKHRLESFEQDDDLFDVIFLDADHSYHSVTQDVGFYANLVRKGGVLAGHDFSKDHLQVVLAVLVHFAQLEEPVTLHIGMETVWFVYRETW
ncbi:unnamed protein product [Amoebophrya sp. A120]|nr:unnamed protein product [Amoebophrya sp. A120]|eukprot:GSA120T00011574001.1